MTFFHRIFIGRNEGVTRDNNISNDRAWISNTIRYVRRIRRIWRDYLAIFRNPFTVRPVKWIGRPISYRLLLNIIEYTGIIRTYTAASLGPGWQRVPANVPRSRLTEHDDDVVMAEYTVLAADRSINTEYGINVNSPRACVREREREKNFSNTSANFLQRETFELVFFLLEARF